MADAPEPATLSRGVSPHSGQPGAVSTTAAAGWRGVAARRRRWLAAIVVAQSAAASLLLWYGLPTTNPGVIEVSLTLLFALLFTWISVGFWMAVAGFLIRRRGMDPYSLQARHPPHQLAATPLARTAVVMPICHEPVARTFAGLRAVYRELERSGQLRHFDVFILSDSQDPEIWLQEQAAWQSLCNELGAGNRLFYRRRKVNLNYKSGNIADFLRRWGAHYRYMVVLDADSLMTGASLVNLVRLMEREPAAGLIQTRPTVVRARTPFARLQQFANQAYSPLFTTGLAAFQLGEATFWGHNAIIRVAPFMAHCGLRKLQGSGLFRGTVISHDFVEAALMGRSGYEVWLEPGLEGSHEESPPTLEDELLRDRRWARGNLQHLAFLLFEPGLRMAHRMALGNGIMAYLAAPFWLLFLVLGVVMLAQPGVSMTTTLTGGAPLLLALTLLMLFGPRVLTLLDSARHGAGQAFGGVPAMTRSLLLETLTSILLAPVRMLAHSRFVGSALLNVRLGWGGQNRGADASWGKALRWHGPGALIGLGWLALGLHLDAGLFLWSLPVVVPLIIAPLLSPFLGRARAGDRLARRGWLSAEPGGGSTALLQDTDATPGYVATPAATTADQRLSPVEQALVLPALNRLHQQLARQPQARIRRLNLARLCQRCLQQGPQSLTRREINQLMSDRQSLAWLHKAVWTSPPDSFWGQRIRWSAESGPADSTTARD